MSAALITIGPGPRNARTDPKTGLRRYTWQGRELLSVTSVRRVAGIPHGLHQWALNQVIDAAIARAPDHAERLASRDGQDKVIASELRKASVAKRDAAAELGLAVHDAAAAGKSLDQVTPEVASRLRQYKDWLAVSGAEILASEFQVWHLADGYAGTADLMCRFSNGDIYVVDIKTGAGLYAEHALQLVAYLNAEFVGTDDVVDDHLTELLKKAKRMAVLHLTETGWRFEVLRSDISTWVGFAGLLDFARWMDEHQSFESVSSVSRSGSAT